jgi:uncharacterized membrane protein YphA (DoxX/SURF4 family)
MNSGLERFATLLGRVLIALLFIPAGFGKIGDFSEAAGGLLFVAAHGAGTYSVDAYSAEGR